MASDAAGIAAITFIVAVAISVGFYQFVYIPEANAKPILPPEVLNPSDTTAITIVPGANVQNSVQNFVPKHPQATLGQSNRVTWTNKDSVPHTVTSDDKYVDKISGSFNSLDQQDNVPGGYVLPGKTFTFVFTATGTYAYHCEPHPWMQGQIDIVPKLA